MKTIDKTQRFLPAFASLLIWTGAEASFAQDRTVPSRLESLARECATEIPWRLDLGKAIGDADAQGKPLYGRAYGTAMALLILDPQR